MNFHFGFLEGDCVCLRNFIRIGLFAAAPFLFVVKAKVS